jgi:hypothetical protein
VKSLNGKEFFFSFFLFLNNEHTASQGSAPRAAQLAAQRSAQLAENGENLNHRKCKRKIG